MNNENILFSYRDEVYYFSSYLESGRQDHKYWIQKKK
jgi:hypothetical protein